MREMQPECILELIAKEMEGRLPEKEMSRKEFEWMVYSALESLEPSFAPGYLKKINYEDISRVGDILGLKTKLKGGGLVYSKV